MHRTLRIATSVFGFSLLAACGGSVGKAVQPQDFTATHATGATAFVCSGEPKLAKPLVVDLDPDSRAGLEAAMSKGLVIVSYDCKNIRVLPTCRLEDAKYDYAGVNRKEQVVQMKTQDDLSVNLPLSVGKLGAEVQSGRSIDLALVLVGMRSTTVDAVDRAALTGNCEGATHFLQTASLGAFSMATGSIGKAAAVAELFKVGASGSSEASRKAMNTDGSLDACRSADPDAKKPPAQCGSPLSVELHPIAAKSAPSAKGADAGNKAGKAKGSPEENPCPTGFNFANGICTRAADAAHLCDPHDVNDCKTQCEKGNAPSCYNYGVSLDSEDKARPGVVRKACDGGHALACGYYGVLIFDEDAAKKEAANPINVEATKYARMSCSMGSGEGCRWLGDMLWGWGTRRPMADPVEAAKAYDRSCSLGENGACWDLSDMYAAGQGVRRDPKHAIELLDRACQGDTYYCTKLGEALSSPDAGELQDFDRAFRVARKACRADAGRCDDAAKIARAVGKNDVALQWAKLACDDSAYACHLLGEFYEEGVGTPKDRKAAKAAYTRACDGGEGLRSACEKAGMKVKKK